MKKISMSILIICLLQTIIFVTCYSSVALDNMDDEFIGLNSEKIKIIYDKIKNPENQYSSNIYQYDNFMESYFDNLTVNHGVNVVGSCGYVGIDMLLCYYDTYLNDNIVPEQYDKVSDGDCYNVICRRNSPGSLFDMPDNLNADNYRINENEIDFVQRNIDYYEYIDNISDVSLHAKLLTIGDSFLFYRNNDETPASLGHSGVKLVLKKYLSDVVGFRNGHEYDILEIKSNAINGNDSDDVRNFVIEKIECGMPVLVSIYDEDGEGHWVIAYDYDSNTDTIYCNFGWGGDATHISPEHCVEQLEYDNDNLKNYYTYKTALAIKFNISHVCSNNYVVTTIDEDGEEIIEYYCYCNQEIEVYSNNIVEININDFEHYYIYECGDYYFEYHDMSYECTETGHVYSCTGCDYCFTISCRFDYSTLDGEFHIKTCSICGSTTSQIHNYNAYNHCYEKCADCGNVRQVVEHDYTDRYVSKDNLYHYAYCICGSKQTKDHTFYETDRSKNCYDCSYSIELNHVHSYVYTPISNGRSHTKTCRCGISKTEMCIGSIAIDGTSRCTKCGQTLPSFPELLSVDEEEDAILNNKEDYIYTE